MAEQPRKERNTSGSETSECALTHQRTQSGSGHVFIACGDQMPKDFNIWRLRSCFFCFPVKKNACCEVRVLVRFRCRLRIAIISCINNYYKESKACVSELAWVRVEPGKYSGVQLEQTIQTELERWTEWRDFF